MSGFRNIKAVFKKQMLSYFKNDGFYGVAGFFMALTRPVPKPCWSDIIIQGDEK